MRSVEGVDEKSEKPRRGKDSLGHEVEAEALSWAVRWVNNSNLHKALHEPSFEHLFRC